MVAVVIVVIPTLITQPRVMLILKLILKLMLKLIDSLGLSSVVCLNVISSTIGELEARPSNAVVYLSKLNTRM